MWYLFNYSLTRCVLAPCGPSVCPPHPPPPVTEEAAPAAPDSYWLARPTVEGSDGGREEELGDSPSLPLSLAPLPSLLFQCVSSALAGSEQRAAATCWRPAHTINWNLDLAGPPLRPLLAAAPPPPHVLCFPSLLSPFSFFLAQLNCPTYSSFRPLCTLPPSPHPCSSCLGRRSRWLESITAPAHNKSAETGTSASLPSPFSVWLRGATRGLETHQPSSTSLFPPRVHGRTARAGQDGQKSSCEIWTRHEAGQNCGKLLLSGGRGGVGGFKGSSQTQSKQLLWQALSHHSLLVGRRDK